MLDILPRARPSRKAAAVLALPRKKGLPMTSDRLAPRYGAVVIVCAIVAVIAVLPERYQIVPSWGRLRGGGRPYRTDDTRLAHARTGVWRRTERLVEFVAAGGALLFNSANLLVAAYNLVENPGNLEPVTLFYTSIGIWTGNVLIFALIYWLVDGDGPDARLNQSTHHPDFEFPAMDDDARVAPGWKPGMVDYLFLAFTTSTAFSPTEAMPLTPRAKILVMIQSSISLITIVIVAPRSINILK